MAYITKTDLENALGVQTVKAIFDDDHDGVPEDGPIDACCNSASADVDAVLGGLYDIPLPLNPVPDIVRYAALDFGVAFAMRRRPEIVEAMNAESWTEFRKAAIEKLKMFGQAFVRLPKAIGTPRNVGATVRENNKPKTTAADSDCPPRLWDKLGDFSR